MNHAITIGGALAACGIIGGILAALFGVLAFFAGMMSDAPEAGDGSGRVGCVLIGLGAAIVALSIWSLT